MSNWDWGNDSTAEMPHQEAWSVLVTNGTFTGFDHLHFPSIVLPKGRKQWRIVPSNAGWSEYDKSRFKTKEAAMVAAKILHSIGVWGE